jgi:hypothetical protein
MPLNYCENKRPKERHKPHTMQEKRTLIFLITAYDNNMYLNNRLIETQEFDPSMANGILFDRYVLTAKDSDM